MEKTKKQQKKRHKFLGKKRKLINYKFHSLKYNELWKLAQEENIKIDINKINQYIKINENIIKGDFIGSFPNGDFLVESNDLIKPLMLKYIVYDHKFIIKVSFQEKRGGKFFLIGKNYGGYFTTSFIKIYLFLENNTKYEIIQKIIFNEKFPHDVIFPFSFTNDEYIYFFLKLFTYENTKITLYKLTEKYFNDNIETIVKKLFEESEILQIDFIFTWFTQKSNNELLFFKEEDDIFDLIVYNFEEKKIVNQKKFNLIKIEKSSVANYTNKVIHEKYLIYTNENLLFLIDVEKMEITSIKELSTIQLLYISDDDIIWTVEYDCKYENIDNKRKKCQYHYLKEYILDKNLLELIQIGERPMTNHYVKNIIQLNNNKVLLFVEKMKVELLIENK